MITRCCLNETLNSIIDKLYNVDNELKVLSEKATIYASTCLHLDEGFRLACELSKAMVCLNVLSEYTDDFKGYNIILHDYFNQI